MSRMIAYLFGNIIV